MITRNKLEIIYKSETGKNPCHSSIEVVRKKKQWILDSCDDDVIDIFGYTGQLIMPDIEYVEWLEKKLDELL